MDMDGIKNMDNCPVCGYTLYFEDDYLFGEEDNDSDCIVIRAKCSYCKAEYHLKYEFKDIRCTGYGN